VGCSATAAAATATAAVAVALVAAVSAAAATAAAVAAAAGAYPGPSKYAILHPSAEQACKRYKLADQASKTDAAAALLGMPHLFRNAYLCGSLYQGDVVHQEKPCINSYSCSRLVVVHICPA
jgi:hypothetical protein